MILHSKDTVNGSPVWTLDTETNPYITIIHNDPKTGKTKRHNFRNKETINIIKSEEKVSTEWYQWYVDEGKIYEKIKARDEPYQEKKVKHRFYFIIISVIIIGAFIGICSVYGTGDRKISRSQAKKLITEYIYKDSTYADDTVTGFKVKEIHYIKKSNIYEIKVEGYYKPYGDYVEIGGRDLKTLPSDIHDEWYVDAKTGACGWR